MNVQGVIFDLDGTLADTLPLVLATYRSVFREFAGTDYSDEQIVEMFGPTEEGVLRKVVPKHWEKAFSRYCTLYESGHDGCPRLFDGIEDLLSWLRRQNIKTALVTGKGRDTTDISLRKLGLDGCFDTVKTGSAEENIKTRCIREIIAEWQLPPADILYVGDAPSDAKDARAAGLIPVAANWSDPQKHYGEASEADLKFDDAAQFMDWLQRCPVSG